MEISSNKDIYQNPLHPYTRALISASPVPDPEISKERIILQGDVPSPIDPPPGCHFHSRCPKAFEACRAKIPELKEIETGHLVRCLLYS